MASLRGTIVAAATGTPIAGALVQLDDAAKRGVRTDANGRFVFDRVASGSYTLTVSTIGYIFVRRRIDIGTAVTDYDVTIPLADGTGTYQEHVTVSAGTAAHGDVGVASSHELSSADLEALRGIAGDDPMRAMQVLPGVVTGDEFQAQFSVRGSAFRDVGVVIDGVATPLLLNEIRGRNDTGSIAMINSDVLDRAALLAGPRPERHGDWLGATAEFDVREGSRDRVSFNGAASGTSASFVLEGPIGRGQRGSWLISARKSYISWLVRRIAPSIDSTVDFDDAQSKLAFDVTPHQQLQLLIVGGSAAYDQLNTPLVGGLSHATSTGAVVSAAWRYTAPRAVVTSRVAFVQSRFQNLGLVQQEFGRGRETQQLARTDVTWAPAAPLTIEGGVKVEQDRDDNTLRTFQSVNGAVREAASRATDGTTRQTSAWGQASWRAHGAGLAAGARATSDRLTGAQVASPWLLGEQSIGAFVVRAGAGVTHEFPDLDLVENASTPLSPARAASVDLSVEHRLTSSTSWQITGYRRDESNVVRLASETRLVSGKRVNGSIFPTWSSTLDGRSRGLEILLQRRAASGLTGWIAYTYAHTQDHDVVTGEAFDGDFDQRHTLNVFVEQRLSYRATISAKIRVGSNVPIVGYFSGTPANLQLGEARNQVRLPTYARLDLRADRTFTFDRTRLTLFVEVVNALNRRNLRQTAGSITGALAALNFTEREVPIVPSVGIRIEF